MKLNIIQRENKFFAVHEGVEYEINVSLIKTDKGVVVVSYEEIKEGDHCYDTDEKIIIICIHADINSYWNKYCKKIIATEQSLSLEGVPQVLFKEDDNFGIFERLVDRETSSGLDTPIRKRYEKYVAIGYNQSQSTHPNSNEDVADFLDWFVSDINGEVSTFMKLNPMYYTIDIVKHWQSLKQPKLVAVEVEDEVIDKYGAHMNGNYTDVKPKLLNGNIIVNKYYYK